MKKITCILIAAILLFTMYSPVRAFEFSTLTATDTDRHWAEGYIRMLKECGIMNGFDGVMNPDSIITRGEFTALVTRAFEMESSMTDSPFADIGTDHIFYSNICAATQNGIIDGFPDKTFRPDNMITREEIMLILSRLTPPREQTAKVSYDDIPVGYKYLSQLTKISNDMIIGGYPDNTFRPYEKTTRAEAATMISKAMEQYITPASDIEAAQAAAGFVANHFANIHTGITGEAAKDAGYVQYTYEKASELGYSLSNEVSNINIESMAVHGPFADCVAVYDVSRNINGSIRTYSGKSEIRLLVRKGVPTVFSHTSQIVKWNFVNLTWEVYSNPPSYDTPGVTAVSPTSFVISTGKSGYYSDYLAPNLYFNSTLANSYVDYARARGYELWVMYKTDFDINTTSAFLNSTTSRQNAAGCLVRNILRYQLDGINFDFENMYVADKGAYTNHVREISIIAHTLGACVSVDVTKYEPTSMNWSMCYDRDALGRYADFVALMAYDQFYSGSKIPGPVAGINWVKSCIELTLQEVPNNKLILGMPYYIRCWKVLGGRTVSSEAISMSKAVQYVTANNAVASYDAKYGLTKYNWWAGGEEFVLWMENADTIRQKVRLAKDYSLAGVASWRRGLESQDVWQAITEEIYR